MLQPCSTTWRLFVSDSKQQPVPRLLQPSMQRLHQHLLHDSLSEMMGLTHTAQCAGEPTAVALQHAAGEASGEHTLARQPAHTPARLLATCHLHDMPCTPAYINLRCVGIDVAQPAKRHGCARAARQLPKQCMCCTHIHARARAPTHKVIHATQTLSKRQRAKQLQQLECGVYGSWRRVCHELHCLFTEPRS